MQVPEVNKDKQTPCREDKKDKADRQRCKHTTRRQVTHSSQPCWGTLLHWDPSLQQFGDPNWGQSCLSPLTGQRCNFSAKKRALLVRGGATAWRKQGLEFAVGNHQLKDLGHFIVQVCTSNSSFPVTHQELHTGKGNIIHIQSSAEDSWTRGNVLNQLLFEDIHRGDDFSAISLWFILGRWEMWSVWPWAN